MGCDIHAFIEYTSLETERKRWEPLCYASLNPGRDYTVFGNLAGVRGGDCLIGPPRGIPHDPSLKVKWTYHDGAADWHTPSWCTPDEFEKCVRTLAPDDPRDADAACDYYAMIAAMRSLQDRGHEVRVVFWFDN